MSADRSAAPRPSVELGGPAVGTEARTGLGNHLDPAVNRVFQSRQPPETNNKQGNDVRFTRHDHTNADYNRKTKPLH